MVRKLMSYDDEIGRYLDDVMSSLKNVGIKNVSKSDALRFIIRQNQEVKLQFKRKGRSNEIVFF